MSGHQTHKRGRIDSFFLPTKRPSLCNIESDNGVGVAVEVETNTERDQRVDVDREDADIEGNECNCVRNDSDEEEEILIELQKPGSDRVHTFHLQRDPGLRTSILQYYRDDIRRAYLNMGAYHPNLKYPKTWDGSSQNRGFNYTWFEKWSWLEYSPAKDAACCFQCFLFETDATRHEAFTSSEFTIWKRVNCGKKCKFIKHEGKAKSPHSIAMICADNLRNQARHIETILYKQSAKVVARNSLRLTTTIEYARWLVFQGCAFRGNDESSDSKNQGNFLELVKNSAKLNKNICEVVLNNAPGNARYTSPLIQKEILNIFANIVREKIREEIGNSKWCILVDEAKDESDKEQMAIVLRYVNKEAMVQERCFDIQRVDNLCVLTLKKGIMDVLTRFNLQVQNLCGQGYDGASNMRSALNGLQSLFLKDCPYAYYVHCFAHRLQLALEKAAKNTGPVWKFYYMLNSIVNLCTTSSKRQGDFESVQEEDILEKVLNGDLETGRGANQVGILRQPSSTRWSSHYNSTCSLIRLFDPACKLIKKLGACKADDGYSVGEAQSIDEEIRSFRFIFVLHLMNEIMGITDILCQGLQLKSQDIINAVSLVKTTQKHLQKLKDDGWNKFIETVGLFCREHNIHMPDLRDQHLVGTGRSSCQQIDNITIEHNYRIDIFNVSIDVQLAELKDRFHEDTMELLILSAALDPRDLLSISKLKIYGCLLKGFILKILVIKIYIF